MLYGVVGASRCDALYGFIVCVFFLAGFIIVVPVLCLVLFGVVCCDM